MGMTDNPVGHKTAVASAGNADTAFIDLWICRQHLIGKLHDIIIIFLSITSADVCKAVSSSVSAAWIAEEYKVTAVCPVLHFVIEQYPELPDSSFVGQIQPAQAPIRRSPLHRYR